MSEVTWIIGHPADIRELFNGVVQTLIHTKTNKKSPQIPNTTSQILKLFSNNFRIRKILPFKTPTA